MAWLEPIWPWNDVVSFVFRDLGLRVQRLGLWDLGCRVQDHRFEDPGLGDLKFRARV